MDKLLANPRFNLYHRFEWQAQPKPGEGEYLTRAQWARHMRRIAETAHVRAPAGPPPAPTYYEYNRKDWMTDAMKRGATDPDLN